MPEVTPVWVVDTCTGADDVDLAKLLECGGEHGFQLRPIGDIGLEEDRSWFSLLLLTIPVHELLSFRPERQVGYENGAAA